MNLIDFVEGSWFVNRLTSRVSLARLLLLLLLCFVLQLEATADKSPVKVGVILPLSGGLAEFGVAVKYGIDLAIQEHKDIFGSVEFIYEDSQYDTVKAISAFNKLRVKDKVSAIYVWGYGPSQGVAPIAEAQKMPTFVISGEKGIALNKRYVVRFSYLTESVAQTLVSYIRSKQISRLDVVKSELAYMDGLLSEMKQQLTGDEQIEEIGSYAPGDTDFKSLLARLRGSSERSIGVFLIGAQIPQFYKQAEQQGLRMVTIGTDAFDSMREVTEAGGAMTGAVFAAQYVNPEFMSRYVARFGNDIQGAFAANGYEFALLTAETFKNYELGSAPDGAARIVDRYTHRPGTLGSSSRYRWVETQADRGFDFDVVLRQVEKDKIVDLTK